MTAEEFQERVLKPLRSKWLSLSRKYPEIYANGVYLVLDNAKWHKAGSALQGITGVKVHTLSIPPQSHDFDQVIEHAINTLKSAADKYFSDHPEISKIADVKAAFEKLFYETVTRDAVRKDVDSLKATYDIVNRSVERGGTAGGWPPKKYRCGTRPAASKPSPQFNAPDRSRWCACIACRSLTLSTHRHPGGGRCLGPST